MLKNIIKKKIIHSYLVVLIINSGLLATNEVNHTDKNVPEKLNLREIFLATTKYANLIFSCPFSKKDSLYWEKCNKNDDIVFRLSLVAIVKRILPENKNCIKKIDPPPIFLFSVIAISTLLFYSVKSYNLIENYIGRDSVTETPIETTTNTITL